MACIHEKDTYFGKRRGYTICLNSSCSGHRHCPEEYCPLRMDDGKGEKIARLIVREREELSVRAALATSALARELDPFFAGAMMQGECGDPDDPTDSAPVGRLLPTVVTGDPAMIF